ncbi:MAG: hypothetical protein LBI79_05180 [Nitrososphaerota archaeon]|nr:hypothetical protein [Nitrososphaerota archaeon]
MTNTEIMKLFQLTIRLRMIHPTQNLPKPLTTKKPLIPMIRMTFSITLISIKLRPIIRKHRQNRMIPRHTLTHSLL